MRSLFAALSLALAFTSSLPAQDRQEPASMVLTNAKIITMDGRLPRAEAMAVQGEWILAVGTVEEIAPYIGPNTKVIDATDRLVVPGFNDSHSHFAGGSRLLRSLNLYGVASLEEVLEKVKELVDRSQPGEWISGSRYDHTLWGDKWPTRQDLDRIAPNNPVVLRRASGHSAWVNSMVLRLSGITKDSEDPHAGQIQRDPETGEPTGILLESAQSLIRRTPRPRLSPNESKARAKEDLINGFRHAASLGVTSVQTSSSTREMDTLRELKDEGKLTLRWTGWLRLGMAKRLAEQGIRSGQGDYWVRTGFLKGFIDGTLGDGTAAVFEPFVDRPDFDGLPTMSQEQLDEQVLIADRNGFQIGIHAIGDKGVNMVLNAYQKAALVNGTKDARHRIEHAQLIKPDDIRRFGALGVIPSMQQTHCTTDMRFAEIRVGLERCKTAYPWRSLIEGGAVIAFGTDWSVEPLDPMRGVFSSVTRTNIQKMQPKTGWFPEQKLTVWESLYYYSYGSAYGEHLENVKGSLAAGRLADFVVLADDLFAIPPEQILDTKVDMTVVGGRLVWDRETGKWGDEIE